MFGDSFGKFGGLRVECGDKVKGGFTTKFTKTHEKTDRMFL